MTFESSVILRLMGVFEMVANSTGPPASSSRFCRPLGRGRAFGPAALAASIICLVCWISCWAMALEGSMSMAF